jgi:hypothetical protein
VNVFLYLTFRVLIYVFVFYPKLVSVLCYLLFGVLAYVFPLYFQKVISSLSLSSFFVISLLHFVCYSKHYPNYNHLLAKYGCYYPILLEFEFY